jgi:hypothetical protein
MTLDQLIKKYKPHEVDFVFPKDGDTRIYLDLNLLYHSPDRRWNKVQTLIFEYFNYHLKQYRSGKMDGDMLVEKLHFPEVPYIALGHCKDGIYGAGSGEERAILVKDSIFDNEDIKEIGLAALAGTSIAIGGWGPDLLSDMVANFGMHYLLEYTEEQVKLYGLKTAEFQIERVLNVDNFEWQPLLKVSLPIFENGEPRILVPRHITKRLPVFTTTGFYDNYLQYVLQEERGDRVKNIRTIAKVPRVPLSEIAEEMKKKYGSTGEASRTLALKRPDDLENYIKSPLRYKQAHTRRVKDKINWKQYAEELKRVKSGTKNARQYADTIRKIFTALYGTSLVNGLLEQSSEDSMFFYDISFGNAAKTAFFTFIKNQQIKAGLVLFEAKNYEKTKVSNPQFNQANGYGIVGARELVIMVTRKPITPRQLSKSRRIFLSHHILVLPISDEDVMDLLSVRRNNPNDFDLLLIKRAQQILQA